MPWCLLLTDPSATEPWYEAWRQNPAFILPIAFGLLMFALALGLNAYKAARRRKFQGIDVLDPLQLEQLMYGKTPLLVDLRSPQDFKGSKGHIRGAVNIPLEELKGRIAELHRKDARALVLIDERDGRAFQAARILQAHQVEWFYVLQGGFHAWRMEHMPTYSGVTKH